MEVKVLFCGEWFPDSPELMARLMPEDRFMNCPVDRVKDKGMDVDVLVPLMHRLEPELISGTRARLIQQFGVGLEGVDIPLATSRGIMVCNVPADVTRNAESTAEHALFLMMGLARRIHRCFRSFREHAWGAPEGEALLGGRALIVGLGRVGGSLASKLSALGMEVEAIRRSPAASTGKDLDLKRIGGPSDLLEMAGRADFVISTVILTDQTKNIFNEALFDVMKPSAFVVNVSRGSVINLDDLMKALESGSIAGGGLDVFPTEPLDPDSPLLSMDNVLATPHIGGVTRQSYEDMGRVVQENLQRFKEGRSPLYCVNMDQIDSTR
jgi:phosphoglycerate dehydrogenase-like enzyme